MKRLGSSAVLVCFLVCSGCGDDSGGGGGCRSVADCNDHGICDFAGNCLCDDGYIGDACEACDEANGYVDAGDGTCVPSVTPCATDADCNNNGVCNIDRLCTCFVGYTGDTCDTCDTANGYVDPGDGSCVLGCVDLDLDGHDAQDDVLCPAGDDYCDFDPDNWAEADCDWCPNDPHNWTRNGCANCQDGDGDGHGDQCDLGADCDDTDDTSYFGALEICGDGIDNDCDGTPDQAAACPGGIGTYVSEHTGDATGAGTQQDPVRTIAQGIANAITLGGGHPVYVAEGTYNEKVTLVEGISILGGYQCDTSSCTWAHDPDTYDSTILNTDRQGVFADVTVSNITVIDGFTIVGIDTNSNGSWQTPGTAVITVAAGTPVISNNTIIAGNEGSCSTWNQCGSYGVRILGPTNDPVNGVLLDSNRIYGGTSNNFGCAAVALVRSPAPIAKVVNNWIKGGTCSWNRAVDAWSAGYGTLFYKNDIFAGSSATGTSFGMIISGYTTVDANRINHDPTEVGSCTDAGMTFWCGGIEAEGATTHITNNVVFGMPALRSAAIFMGDGETPFGLITMNGNTLDGAGRDVITIANISTALACRTTQGTNAKVGRIANNILLGGRGVNRFGMYEMNQTGGRTCEPIIYENNDIFFPTNAGSTDNAHRQWTGGGQQVMLPTTVEVNLQSYAQANFTGDPLLDLTFHLTTGSPCIDAGTLTDAPATDMDGEVRPKGAGIDVGADEAE
jgi:hypothetical protein